MTYGMRRLGTTLVGKPGETSPRARRWRVSAIAAAMLLLAHAAAPRAAVVTVDSGDLVTFPAAGWWFVEEVTIASGTLVLGPATPPLGVGSAHMTLDATGRELLGTLDYAGTRLDQFTRLEYSTYRSSADAGNNLAISLQLEIDFDVTDLFTGFQGRLVFEPYFTPGVGGTIISGQWRTWNALAGRWWSSKATSLPAYGSACPQSSPCTWAQVLANYPNAGLRTGTGNGSVLLKAGGPWPGFDGNVDALTIGVSSNDTTYDFEPCTQDSDCDDGDPCSDDACGSVGGAFICEHEPNTDAACEDGHPCTANDTCQNGVCVGGSPPDCDDINPCTDDSCSSVGGSFVCDHVPNTDPCDDGNLCTVDDTCADGACVGTTDLHKCHFSCYEIRRQPFSLPGVSLIDQFGSSVVTLSKAERLCAPTDKNDEDPLAPTLPGHLEGYVFKAPFTRVLNQRIVNQFGTITVDLLKTSDLLVPTAKSLTSPPPLLSPPTPDHFNCYKVRISRNTPKFIPVTGVKLDDQFGTVTGVTIVKPLLLCAPVDKNGEDPGAETHEGHLMCYKTKQPPFGQLVAFLNNQFGPQTKTLIQRREFCVLSLKNP